MENSFQTPQEWQQHILSFYKPLFTADNEFISKEDFKAVWKESIDQTLADELIEAQFDQSDLDKDGLLSQVEVESLIQKQFQQEMIVETVSQKDVYNSLLESLEMFKAKIRELYSNEISTDDPSDFMIDLKEIQLKVYGDSIAEKLIYCKDQLESLITMFNYKDQSSAISFNDIDELMKLYKTALKKEQKELEQKMEAKTLVNLFQECHDSQQENRLISQMMSIIQKGSSQYFTDDDKFQLEIAFASYQNNKNDITKRETLYTILEAPNVEDQFLQDEVSHNSSQINAFQEYKNEELKYDFRRDVEIQKLQSQISQLNVEVTTNKQKYSKLKKENEELLKKLQDSQNTNLLQLGQSNSAKMPQKITLELEKANSGSIGTLRQQSMVSNQMQTMRKNTLQKQTTNSQRRRTNQSRFGNESRSSLSGYNKMQSNVSSYTNTQIIRGSGGDDNTSNNDSFDIEAISDDHFDEEQEEIDFKRVKRAIRKDYEPDFHDDSLQVFKSNIYLWITSGNDSRKMQSYIVITSKMLYCFERSESNLQFAVPLDAINTLFLSFEDKNVGAFYFNSPQKIADNNEFYFFYETCKTLDSNGKKSKNQQEVFSENQRLVMFLKNVIVEDKVKKIQRKIPVIYKDPIAFTNAQKQEKVIYMYSMYMMNATDKYQRFQGTFNGKMEEAYYTTLGYIFNATDWKEGFYVILNGYLCKYSEANLDQIVQEYQLSNYRPQLFVKSREYSKKSFVIRLNQLKNKKYLEFAFPSEEELQKWASELSKYCEK